MQTKHFKIYNVKNLAISFSSKYLEESLESTQDEYSYHSHPSCKRVIRHFSICTFESLLMLIIKLGRYIYTVCEAHVYV